MLHSTKLLYHLVVMAAGRTRPEVPAGLSRAAARHSVGPPEAGRPPAERGGARTAVRRVPHHRRTRGARPAGGGAGRAPGRLRHLRQAAPASAGRAVVRPAHSRSRRDRDLRANLPGHDGVAAGAASTRCSGAACNGASGVEGRTRLAAVPAIHRPPRVGRVLRAARADRRKGRRQRADRAGARRRAAFPSSCSIAPCVPYPQRGHHDLVGIDNRRAGYRHHRAPAAARRAAASRSSPLPHAAATVDAREAGYREALLCRGRRRSTRHCVQRLDPTDTAASAR